MDSHPSSHGKRHFGLKFSFKAKNPTAEKPSIVKKPKRAAAKKVSVAKKETEKDKKPGTKKMADEGPKETKKPAGGDRTKRAKTTGKPIIQDHKGSNCTPKSEDSKGGNGCS